jgi:hypothetical protein
MTTLSRTLSRLACVCGVAASFLSLSPKAMAKTTLFSENFSNGLSRWEFTRDDGRYWRIVDGQVEGYVDRGSTVTEMVPKDEYWDESWHNIEYSLDFTPLEGVDRNISFNFENLTNWYEIHFVDTFYNLMHLKNGSAYFNIFGDFQMKNNQTYHIVIRFDEGHVEIFVDGVKIADKLDWTFNNNFGKIGIKAGTGAVSPTRVRFDNISVTTLENDTTLSVGRLAQTDPQWATQEYDHATKWSAEPTLKRWGCAVSSMAMIMRYHGLTQLPDGTAVSPASLNAWLKNQSDGYLGEGALNWVAVTRLTKQISQAYNTVKLEYTRSNGPSLSPAIAEAEQQKPSIVEIPGHFLVASGFTSDKQDLLITDPAYSYTKLSQHKKSLVSTREFQPSHTDLSYIVVASDRGTTLSLSNGQGSSWQDTPEVLTDQLDGSGETAHAQVLEVPKPNRGSYTLKATRSTPGTTKVQIFAYTKDGELTDLSQELWLGQSGATWTLNYNKEGASTLQRQMSFTHFRQLLSEVETAGGFSKQPWFVLLLKMTNVAEQLNVGPKQGLQARLIATLAKQTPRTLTLEDKHVLTTAAEALTEYYPLTQGSSS